MRLREVKDVCRCSYRIAAGSVSKQRSETRNLSDPVPVATPPHAAVGLHLDLHVDLYGSLRDSGEKKRHKPQMRGQNPGT